MKVSRNSDIIYTIYITIPALARSEFCFYFGDGKLGQKLMYACANPACCFAQPVGHFHVTYPFCLSSFCVLKMSVFYLWHLHWVFMCSSVAPNKCMIYLRLPKRCAELNLSGNWSWTWKTTCLSLTASEMGVIAAAINRQLCHPSLPLSWHVCNSLNKLAMLMFAVQLFISQGKLWILFWDILRTEKLWEQLAGMHTRLIGKISLVLRLPAKPMRHHNIYGAGN